MLPVSHMLERSRRLFPDRLALVGERERYTYAELGARVARLASALLAQGLVPGDRVALIDRNSAAFVETYLACAHAGLILVPINFRLAPPEIDFILRDADARLLLAAPDFLPQVSPVLDERCGVRLVVIQAGEPELGVGYERLIQGASSEAPPATAAPDDVIVIYYTSGSTGVPKGVCITHANTVAGSLDAMMLLTLHSRDVYLHSAPLFHMASAMFVWPMVWLGATQVACAFDPLRTLEVIGRERVTITAAPMTLFAMLASRLSEVPVGTTAALRHMIYGGAPTPGPMIERAWQAFGPVLTHVYAMTECAGFVTCLDASEHEFSADPDARRRTSSAGRPAPTVQVRIVDDEGRDVPHGEMGEVVVRGPKVTTGYWRRPAETAAAIRDGWLHSGDMGRMDEQGYVHIADRKKDMIITGGENVFPVEVEAVIAAQPGVQEVAVIGVPDEKWGEAVKAVVVPRAGESIDPAELIAACRRQLAGYKVPKSVDVRDEPLPTTGPGKIAKRIVRAPYWAGQDRKI